MYRVISLFSGCGGLDIGFQDAGFAIVYACDVDHAAVDCYARNVGDHVHKRDVRTDAFSKDIDSLSECDIVLGGFPCQGFSKAGPKRADDDRNQLYQEMLTAVHRLRPRIFIAENVDGMRQYYRGSYVRKIQEDFDAVGYRVEYRVLNAAAFGLPQHRRRIFFAGIRKGQGPRFRWPKPTHGARSRNGETRLCYEEYRSQSLTTDGMEVLTPVRTIRDAIGELPELGDAPPDHTVTASWPQKYGRIMQRIGPGQKLCNVRNGATSVKTWHIPEAFGPVTPNQSLILDTIARHRRHKKYGRRPNGNPIPIAEIGRLTLLVDVDQELHSLARHGYVKDVGDGHYDLQGAMFCSGIFKRPLWDEPSPTVLTNFHNPRYFLHPEKDRPFSLRECARLQGFPDDFVFESSTVTLIDGYRLVGNAVPPPVGSLFATACRQVLAV